MPRSRTRQPKRTGTLEERRVQRELEAAFRARIDDEAAGLRELDRLKGEACVVVSGEGLESLNTAVHQTIDRWLKKARPA